MKKLLIVLGLAVVMCVPRASFAESMKRIALDPKPVELDSKPVDLDPELARIKSKILESMKNLGDIKGDLEKLFTDKSSAKAHLILLDACNILELCRCNYGYSHTLLHYRFAIKPEYHVQWRDDTITFLHKGKTNLSNAVEGLQFVQGETENETALPLIDKAKELIRSSLPLYDKAIQGLESEKQ
jgi:hypothetical protein